MMREPNKRPRRNPLTPEEVSNIIAHKKKRELVKLQRFKKSRQYKILNLFIVSCIFIYLELLFCYFGPCHYNKHFSINTVASYDSEAGTNGKPVISDLDVYDVNGKVYKFIIGDNIEIPPKNTYFLIGKDFILQKELKGVLPGSLGAYRLFSANPILFFCFFSSFISFFGFVMNLNENAYTLAGLAILNTLTLLGILAL